MLIESLVLEESEVMELYPRLPTSVEVFALGRCLAPSTVHQIMVPTPRKTCVASKYESNLFSTLEI